jgi:hypothetical protein
VLSEAVTVAGVGPEGEPKVSQVQLLVPLTGAALTVNATPAFGLELLTEIRCAGGDP